MTKINPWLIQAEKIYIERISDISKNPINSQTIQLLKGHGSEPLWGLRQQELREMSIFVSWFKHPIPGRKGGPSLVFVPQTGVDRVHWLAEGPINSIKSWEITTQRAARMLLAKHGKGMPGMYNRDIITTVPPAVCLLGTSALLTLEFNFYLNSVR